MNKFNLSNRVAIVTGGAQGFGLAISERFIQSDAKVIIWDVDKKAAETAIKNCVEIYIYNFLPFIDWIIPDPGI